MSEPTNAERLRGILTGDSGYMAEQGISHIVANEIDVLRKIRSGELIVIARERAQSILSELEAEVDQ